MKKGEIEYVNSSYNHDNDDRKIININSNRLKYTNAHTHINPYAYTYYIHKRAYNNM